MSKSNPADEYEEESLLFNRYFEEYNKLMEKNLWILSPAGNISYFAQHKISILKKILPENPRTLLEYGCGIGNNLFYLQKLFPDSEIWGCDTSEGSLNVARKQFPRIHFFSLTDAIKTPQFDCVLVGDVLHHIPSNQRDYYMKKITDYIREGGFCVFFEHNPYNPLTRILVSTCPFDAHAELVTPSNLKKIIRNHSLEVLDTKYCFFFPEFLKNFDKYEDRISKLPVGGKYYVLAVKTS